MWTWIHRAGSPKTTYLWSLMLQRWCFILSVPFLCYGLLGALWLAPPDYQQGDVYRIMYIHVPLAIGSLALYTSMSVAALIFLVWKIKVGDILVEAGARLGALYTVMTLITGAIWGQPTWGTWWIWDARLTSELILLFIYLGIIVIRTAIPDRLQGAKAACVVTLIGFINIPIIHYSVYWWHTLHQGSSIFIFKQSTIALSMLHPLLAMIGAFFFYSIGIMCIQVRAELLKRESQANWVTLIKGGL